MLYRYADICLDSTTRLASRAQGVLAMPRQVFDCLVYLIEHRGRAVPGSELALQLWKNATLTDVELAQIVRAARSLLGEDADGEQLIRSVPGAGYRWVAPVQVIGAAAEATRAGTPPPLMAARSGDAPLGRYAAAAAVLAVTALLLVLIVAMRQPAAGLPAATGRVLVLPAQLPAGEGTAPWLRLGVMELVAARLREQGLVVPPGESTLAALNAAERASHGAPVQAQDLDADMLVQPRLQRVATGWQLDLELSRTQGAGLAVLGEAADAPLQAAAIAADALLASLGRPSAPLPEAPDEIAWQLRAGLLGEDLDGLQAWLASLPPAVRSSRETRYLAAELDYRAGRLERSRDALDGLLAEPSGGDLVFRGRLLIARGSLDLRLHDDTAGARDFGAAIDILEAAAAPRELGRALTGRGGLALRQLRLEEAGRDLSRARSLLASAGDDLGVARTEVNLALLQRREGRPLEALAQLQVAAARFSDYAALNELGATLARIIDLQCALLRWDDALASSERAQPLLARLPDRHQRVRLLQARAGTLLGLGRLGAAQQALDDIATLGAGAAHENARSQLLAAQIAFARGDPQRAAALARPLLADQADENLLDIAGPAALLLQRAQPTLPRERIAVGAALAGSGRDDASALLARGLNLQFLHQPDAAESLLRDALQRARASRDLRDQRDATEAIAGLLLGEGRAAEALEMAAPLAAHVSRDFDTALLFARLQREQADGEGWRLTRQSAAALAGERVLPAALDLPRSAAHGLLRGYRKAE